MAFKRVITVIFHIFMLKNRPFEDKIDYPVYCGGFWETGRDLSVIYLLKALTILGSFYHDFSIINYTKNNNNANVNLKIYYDKETQVTSIQYITNNHNKNNNNNNN